MYSVCIQYVLRCVIICLWVCFCFMNLLLRDEFVYVFIVYEYMYEFVWFGSYRHDLKSSCSRCMDMCFGLDVYIVGMRNMEWYYMY